MLSVLCQRGFGVGGGVTDVATTGQQWRAIAKRTLIGPGEQEHCTDYLWKRCSDVGFGCSGLRGVAAVDWEWPLAIGDSDI